MEDLPGYLGSPQGTRNQIDNVLNAFPDYRNKTNEQGNWTAHLEEISFDNLKIRNNINYTKHTQ
jgi:hypothetical protein